MSLIITVHTNEGIIMASDSRITCSKEASSPLPDGSGTVVNSIEGVHYSDTAFKTILCPNNSGISFCGNGSVSNKPIGCYLEDFINKKITKSTKVSKMPQLLIDYFSRFDPVPDTTFHVAGYEKKKGKNVQVFYRLLVKSKGIYEVDTSSSGTAWNGEGSILADMINCHWEEEKNADGEVSYIKVDPPDIAWNFFTLQDGVDFAVFAIKTTENLMRFREQLKTVGGPIDILIIKPSTAFWLNHKELHFAS